MREFWRRAAGRTTAGRGYGRVRDALVVAEVALAFVLASGATLVISEMERLRDSDNGMTTENVVTFHLGQPMAQGIELQYYDIAWRVGQIPGVQAAGFTQVLPLQNWGWSSSSTDFFVRGTAPRREAPLPNRAALCDAGLFPGSGHSDSRRTERRGERHGRVAASHRHQRDARARVSSARPIPSASR